MLLEVCCQLLCVCLALLLRFTAQHGTAGIKKKTVFQSVTVFLLH